MADADLVELVRTHEPALLRLAFLLCRDGARAEDLVQDALIKVMRRWRRSGRVPEHPLAYTRKALVNEYLAWRRLRWSGEVIGPVGETAIPDASAEFAERDLMWRLLGELPARARSVLVLRYYEQLPDREIAAVLGCREATVRSISARALAVLRANPILSGTREEA